MAYPAAHKDGFCLYKVAEGHDANDPIFEKLSKWSSWFSYAEAHSAVFGVERPRRPAGLDGFLAPAGRPKYRKRADTSEGNWVATSYNNLPEDLYFAIPVELYVELTAPEMNELGEVHP